MKRRLDDRRVQTDRPVLALAGCKPGLSGRDSRYALGPSYEIFVFVDRQEYGLWPVAEENDELLRSAGAKLFEKRAEASGGIARGD